MVVIDGVLSPVQQRNLERALKCKVIDRTGLILEIFGARARTREGVMQVELAALTYQRSRLVRSWTHLERQRGGHGFMGGPGETQIEADRADDRPAHHPAAQGPQGGRPHPGPAPPSPPPRALSGGCPHRLHQRRQVDPVPTP